MMDATNHMSNIAQAPTQARLLSVLFPPELIDSVSERRLRHAKLRLLMIDDDPVSCRAIEAALNRMACVLTANTAEEGLKKHVYAAPHIVLLDIELPDYDGHHALQKLLSFDPQAYVVMLSGHGNAHNVRAAVAAGAKGFIGKPFEKSKLLECIDRYKSKKTMSG